MVRIKLSLPENPIASFTIPIRITDINYGNHVGNNSFTSIIHEARMLWLSSHGYTELNIEGTGLIMADLAVEFKAEAFYGDVLTADVYAGEISTTNFELYYRLCVTRKDVHFVVAKAKTGMISIDYVTKKIIPLPAGLLSILKEMK